MSVVLLGIFGYIFLQLLIGVLVSRRIASEADYFLAGRRLGPGLTTFSIFATWFGAETCIGAAGRVYSNGLSGTSADPFGYAICLFLLGLVFAVPLWRRRFTTLADLFRARYSPGVERFAVLLMAPTSVMWAAAQIRAFGQVLAVSSEFEVTLAITVAAAVVIIYTVYGGLMADVVTDLVQGVVLIIGLAVVLVVVFNVLGDTPAAATVPPERLQLFGGPETSWLQVLEKWAVPITGSVLAQELISRVLASRSPEIARRAALYGGGLYLAIGLIPVFIGLVGPALMPGLQDPEQLLPRLAQAHLSTFFYILFAGALISAILSTVDSALLAASALVSHNLIVPLAPTMSEKAKVRTARAGVIVLGLVAYGLALSADGIYSLVQSASAFGGAGIFVVCVFGLFTRLGGVRAATAALIVSAGVWSIGEYFMDFGTPYLVSMVCAFIAYLVFGLKERQNLPATPLPADAPAPRA